MLRENFKKYIPERDLAFDEGTYAFKSQLSFRVYNPTKPNKFGIKLYEFCESTSGYLVVFVTYDGHTESAGSLEVLESVDDDGNSSSHFADLMTMSKIILGMTARAGLLNQGKDMYMDNYYTSPELVSELDSMDTYACGTQRISRRGVPCILKTAKLKQGETIFRRKENMLVLKFKDKRDVHMLSTIHPANMAVTNKVDRNKCEPIWKLIVPIMAM